MAATKGIRFIGLSAFALACVVGGVVLAPRLARWVPWATGAAAPQRLDVDRPGVAVLSVARLAPEGQPTTDGEWRRAINSHVALLRSPALFDEAIQDPASPVRQTQWFKDASQRSLADARRAAREAMKVHPIPDTTLIAVKFDCQPPADAAVITNELCNLAIQRRLEGQRKVQQEKVKLLARQADMVRIELDEEIIKPLREKELMLGNDQVGTSSNWNGIQRQFEQMLDDRWRMARELPDLRNRLEALEASSKGKPALLWVDQEVRDHPEYARARERAELAEMELQDQAARSGEKDEAVERLRKRHAMLRDRLNEKAIEVRGLVEARARSKLSGEIEARAATTQLIQEHLSRVSMELGQLNKTMNDYRILQAREAELRNQVQSIGDEMTRIRQFVLAAPWADLELARPAKAE